mgnify:CR=1 FL=1|tara:strand:- start:397 stop:528 length:132 start_codon:yes stop_codon:yes gene_type:complete
MPSYLRSFYIQKLIETRKKENDEMKKAQRKPSSASKPNIPRFK